MNKKHIPIRTCLICKKKYDKSTLVRLTAKDEFYVMDKTHKNQSRGIYICHSIDCFSKLLKHNRINLNTETKMEILKNIKNNNVDYLNTLKTIKNSGHLVFGIKMIEENIKKIHLIFIANDINIKNKNNLITRCKENNIKYIFVSDKSSLGYVFNKEEVNAIGITNKKIAKGLYSDEGGLNES